jgi:Na+/proline symporter
MLYRQLFFLPLFLVEFSTVLLLTLLPSMRVTARAAYAAAGMFVVFAVWAAFGFAFPAEPLPLALNVISKILCFVAAIMLFAWRTDEEALNRR